MKVAGSNMLRFAFIFGVFSCWTYSALGQDAPADPPAAAAEKPAKPKSKPKPKKPATPAPAADAAAGAEKASLLEKMKEWTVFIHEGQDGRVCFASSAPIEMDPKASKRTRVVFYLTTWQKDGIRNEVSIKQGYPVKSASVTVGTQKFSMFSDDDKAFVKDVAEEKKLIAAMSAGGTMSVKATSSKGTTTTDQYSLDGLPEALKKIQEACPPQS